MYVTKKRAAPASTSVALSPLKIKGLSRVLRMVSYSMDALPLGQSKAESRIDRIDWGY